MCKRVAGCPSQPHPLFSKTEMSFPTRRQTLRFLSPRKHAQGFLPHNKKKATRKRLTELNSEENRKLDIEPSGRRGPLFCIPKSKTGLQHAGRMYPKTKQDPETAKKEFKMEQKVLVFAITCTPTIFVMGRDHFFAFPIAIPKSYLSEYGVSQQGGWFPGPFLDETFEAFEAFEGPRVEGGGGGEAAEGEEAFEGFEGEDEGFEAPFKAFEGFEAFEGEDEGTFEAFEAPFRVSKGCEVFFQAFKGFEASFKACEASFEAVKGFEGSVRAFKGFEVCLKAFQAVFKAFQGFEASFEAFEAAFKVFRSFEASLDSSRSP